MNSTMDSLSTSTTEELHNEDSNNNNNNNNNTGCYCIACGQQQLVAEDDVTNQSISSSSSVLCQDCQTAAEWIVATSQEMENDDDDEVHSQHDTINDSFRYEALSPPKTSTSRKMVSATSSVVVSPESYHTITRPIRTRNSTTDAAAANVSVSSCIDTKKNGNKLCCQCKKRTVVKDVFDYCTKCYAIRSTKMEREMDGTKQQQSNNYNNNKLGRGAYKDDNINNVVTPTGVETKNTTGRCRLCVTGIVIDTSYEYCVKCYHAKLRDDTKRYEKKIQQEYISSISTTKTKKHHIPYICMECGNTIQTDCSWKTMCPPCFKKSPKRPKLLRTPFVKKRLLNRNKVQR